MEANNPERYKESVINDYLDRAYNVTSSWELFHWEVKRIKQVLINNNYFLQLIDHITEKL